MLLLQRGVLDKAGAEGQKGRRERKVGGGGRGLAREEPSDVGVSPPTSLEVEVAKVVKGRWQRVGCL